MEFLVLIAHGVLTGAMTFAGFFLFLGGMFLLIDGDVTDKRGRQSLIDKAMDKLPIPLLMLSWLVVPLALFVLAFVPLSLAMLFGPAYWFDLEWAYSCNSYVASPRMGITEISHCQKWPVWLGWIVGMGACVMFYRSRGNTELDPE